VTGETFVMCAPRLNPVKGFRHVSLLRVAGSWARRGWVSRDCINQLLGAASQVGLDQADALRIIQAIFSKEARQGKSRTGLPTLPALTGTGHGQGGRGCVTGIVPLRQNDLSVLKTSLEEIKTQHAGRGKWNHLRDAWAHVLSGRFIAERSGIAPRTAARSLDRLCRSGMLWLSPRPYRLKNGRLAYQYRPTFIGVALAEQQLGVNPWRGE
jgi:hypothetical protein